MANVFELVEDNDSVVVLKVNADDPLTIALNPYVNATYNYISVTKGKNHILTIVKKDGSTFSFHWGISGYTLICESLDLLRRKVIEFIKLNNITIE